MKISVVALAALWLPSLTLNLMAGSGMSRGYMRIAETTHYELLTMEIFTRALRSAVRPARTAFKVTPKQGIGNGGTAAAMKLHLVILCALLLSGGIVMRLLDLSGIGPLPDLPGLAAIIVPALGLIELRRVLRTIVLVGARRQRRLVYRFEGEAPAHCFTPGGHVAGTLVDASPSGLGLVMHAPLRAGERVLAMLSLQDAAGETKEIAAHVEVRSCRQSGDQFLVGASIVGIDPASRMRLMEWCYVVCAHERLRGHRPATPPPALEPIPVPADEPAPVPARTAQPQLDAA
jgi:hypothetical protein